MTTLKRRSLEIDDPLGPSQSTEPNQPPTDELALTPGTHRTRQAAAKDNGTSKPERQRKPGAVARASTAQRQEALRKTAGQGDSEVWREWSGLTGVGSFRLPHELLAELGDTARQLELPIGLIVAAAITQLLDQPPEQIAALVDRADDARIHGRRTSRRRLTERASR
jgi:hypothetical protein